MGLVQDKKDFTYGFPSNGQGQGDTCDISGPGAQKEDYENSLENTIPNSNNSTPYWIQKFILIFTSSCDFSFCCKE